MVGPVAGSCRSRIWRPWVRMGAECSSRRRRTSTGSCRHRESDTERLGRALVLAGNRWSRLYYGAAVKALGERFILEEFDAVLSAAASFVERVDGLSDFGRAALEAEVEKAGEPTVAAAGRGVGAVSGGGAGGNGTPARRRAKTRRGRGSRGGRYARRSRGRGGWSTRSSRSSMEPPGSRRSRSVNSSRKTAARWIREDIDVRKAAICVTEAGAWFLREAQRQRVATAAPPTLAEDEQFVEVVKLQLVERQAAAQRTARQEKLVLQPGGRDLYFGVLTGWTRPGTTIVIRVAVKHIDTALEYGGIGQQAPRAAAGCSAGPGRRRLLPRGSQGAWGSLHGRGRRHCGRRHGASARGSGGRRAGGKREAGA